MFKLFSQHVGELAAGANVDQSIQDHIFPAITEKLSAELRRRHIFDYGPRLLGYNGKTWDNDTLKDLTQDCYVRTILTRLRGLMAALQGSGDIEGLVIRNIKNFVGERQTTFDPIGSNLYKNAQSVLRELENQGQLKRIDTNIKPFSADTLVDFPDSNVTRIATQQELKTALLRSNQLSDNLQDLIDAPSRAKPLLTRSILELKNQHLGPFCVASLNKEFLVLLQESGHLAPRRQNHSTSDFDLIASQDHLVSFDFLEIEELNSQVAKLQSKIETLSLSRKVKERLNRMLIHLASLVHSRVEKHPTLDQLAAIFGVARSTLYDNIDLLKKLSEQLRENS